MWNDVMYFVKIIIPSNGERSLMFVGGIIGATASFLFGEIDQAFIWLVVLAIVDYLTGTAASLKECHWCSDAGFRGLFKKFSMFFIVALCHGIDHTTNTDLLRNIAIFAYSINEAGSILENIERLGYGKLIPPFLKRGLKILKDKEKELLKNE